jgi:hypothetical protein
MDRQFQKSIVYSALFHALLLFAVILFYNSFLLTRTPLMMELTLIGQMSQGNGLGSPSSNSGETPAQKINLMNGNSSKMPFYPDFILS